jgi:hypothetical protein
MSVGSVFRREKCCVPAIPQCLSCDEKSNISLNNYLVL